MADTSKQISSALQGIGGAAGVIGSWIGAYASAPKRKSIKPFMNNLQQAGDYQYQAGSMDSLMEQRQNQPYLQALSTEDLYNPSFGESFASSFGAGMSSFGAMKDATSNLEGNLGTTYLNGSSGYNTATGKGWGDMSSKARGAEVQKLAASKLGNIDAGMVQPSENPFDYIGQTRDMIGGTEGMRFKTFPFTYNQNYLKMKSNNEASTPFIGYSQGPWDYKGKSADYMNASKLVKGLSGTFDYLGSEAMDVYDSKQQGPNSVIIPGYSSMPGYEFANGGMMLDNGAMASTGLGLLSGFIGVGLNAAAQARQRRLAETEADMYNANKAFVNDRQNHNFALAVNDTKDNMFNNQALQMMAFGGDLSTQGADFPLNGDYNYIGAGGSHEQNPLMGVPQGISADGKPNLVEEGEVVWNDYVFSKRLTIPEKFAKEHKIKSGTSFAEAAEILSAEAKERPNDPISQNGLEAALGSLQGVQEDVRMKQQARKVKAAVKKMSPEELMQLQQMLGQVAPQEGMQEGQMFADGGNMTEKEREALINSRRFEATIAQLAQHPEDLKAVASSLSGYNANNFTSGNYISDLLEFIRDAYKNDPKSYDALMKTINSQNMVNLMGDDDERRKYTYSGNEEDWWNANKYIWENYTGSKGKSNAQGKYGIASDGNASNEGNPEYERFVSYVTDNLEDAIKNYGTEAGKNTDWIVNMMKLNDANINTENGAPKILTYDDKGNVTGISEGGVDLYNRSAHDGLNGTRHLYTNLAEKSGRRQLVVDENGAILDMDYNNISPMYSKVRQYSTIDPADKDGNYLSTDYIVVKRNPYGSDATAPTDVEKDTPTKLPTMSRYAPVLGSAIGALQSMTETPHDYSVAYQPRQATYQPIGDYLAYDPIDSQRYLSAEQQRLAAQMAAIQNATGANKNMAMAQASIANQGHQANIANILSSIEGLNFGRKAQVGDFNRGTNQGNAQAFDALSQFNAEQWNSIMPSILQENARKRMAVDTAMDESRGANLSTLFTNIGNIGSENLAYNMANSNPALYFGAGLDGSSSYKGKPKAKGGMLTKKDRRK